MKNMISIRFDVQLKNDFDFDDRNSSTHNKHYNKCPQLSTRKPQIPKCKLLHA